MNKAAAKKAAKRSSPAAERTMAAGAFKAKCLRIMDEVDETGVPLVVTKRGKPVVKVVPITNGKDNQPDDIFGRLEGIIEMHGDPDDLVYPIIPQEDWEMLK